jgi:hypothetical protein
MLQTTEHHLEQPPNQSHIVAVLHYPVQKSREEGPRCVEVHTCCQELLLQVMVGIKTLQHES